MKNLSFVLLSTMIFSIFISCNQQTEQTKSSVTSQTFSNAYKPPIFVNDDRVAHIKSIAPEIERLMLEHMKAKNIPGIAYGIVVDNELVLTSAMGLKDIANESPATPKSSFRIASMTKSFTAMAIMKLRDEGKLSLNDPVSKYIPQIAALEYLTRDSPAIDIENLLTMTAGFPEDNPWGDRQLDESDAMLIDLFKAGFSFSNPTSYKFEYSNTGYALLGNIISHVSGISYQKYIQEHILQPMGMNQTYWEYTNIPEEQLVLGYRWEEEQWKLEPMLHDGSFGAMGGLITSIEDFSKYVSFQLSAWPPRNDEDMGPVKRSSLREMQTPQFSKLYAKAQDLNGDPCPVNSGYGFGLGIATKCDGLTWVTHGGALPGFGSNYRFYPEYGIGLMAFCNLTYTSPWPIRQLDQLLFDNPKITERQLPVSAILKERKEQIVQFIQSWDKDLESKILAKNFYLDTSRNLRMSLIQEALDKAGKIETISEIVPGNQLRGQFKLNAENGIINIYFTLTPEKYPMVQMLNVSFESNETY